MNEAVRLMRTIAQSNGKHLPDEAVLALDEEAKSTTSPNKDDDDELELELELGNKDAITGSLIDVIKVTGHSHSSIPSSCHQFLVLCGVLWS